MYTNNIFTLLFLSTALLANAQTWIGGSEFSDQPGNYSTNLIGARANAACWVDNDQVWVFGGLGYGTETLEMEIGLLNDLWKFNSAGWTFVNGSTLTNAPSNYDPLFGALFPGGRANAIHWQTHDQLWLFGGVGVDSSLEDGMLNDVWAYNISSGLWQWKGGSQLIDVPPQYNATLPVPPSNYSQPANPGSRECSFSWFVKGKDGTDKLWLFGGMTTEEVLHTDVWTYDLTLNTWEWVAGSNISDGRGENNASAPGGPSPSARGCGASWADQDGNLYLFGGHYVDEMFETVTLLNDVWQFNTTTKQWKNLQQATPTGVYNNTINDRPAPRYSPAYASDGRGNLFLFGGRTPLVDEESPDTMNDLWYYDTSANTWKWLLGSSTPNSPGVYNMTTRKGTPSARGSACLWIDQADKLWLFGGSNSTEDELGFRNDLWILIDDVHPNPPTTSTTGGSTTGSETSTITSGTGVPTTTGSSNYTTTGPINNTLTTGAFTTGPVPTTSTTGHNGTSTATSSTGSYNSTTSTTGGRLTTGYNPTSTTGHIPVTTTGNSTAPHSGSNTAVIVASTVVPLTISAAGVIGFLWYRGSLRVTNLFRKRDAEEENELLPINYNRGRF